MVANTETETETETQTERETQTEIQTPTPPLAASGAVGADRLPSPSPSTSPTAAEIEREFEEVFWPAYPVHESKKPALQAFRRARRRVSLETIMAGVARYTRRLRQPDAPKAKWPQGWLNDERWNDAAPPSHAPPPPAAHSGGGNNNNRARAVEAKPNAPRAGTAAFERMYREAGG